MQTTSSCIAARKKQFRAPYQMPYRMTDAKSYAAAAVRNANAPGMLKQQSQRGRVGKTVACPDMSSSAELGKGNGQQSRASFQSSIARGCSKTKENSRNLKNQSKGEDSVATVPIEEESFEGGSRRVESPVPFHKPNTDQEEDHVYVLTLQVTESLSMPMNEMREKHFPKHLNKTPAHLTLFHALPHSQIDLIKQNLSTLSGATTSFYISTGTPFRMRRGVGVNLGDGLQEFRDLRNTLRSKWSPFLSEQDGGGWHPHWTVMNKVDEPKRVHNSFNTIRRDLFENVQQGRAVGLDLWKYNQGHWEWVKEYDFLCNGKGPANKSDDSPGSVSGESRSFSLSSWASGRKGSASSSHSKRLGRQDGNSGKVAGIWRTWSFGRRS